MPRPPGSGKPKGYKATQTLDKEAMRQRIRERVAEELEPLLTAQIANAKGVAVLVSRDAKTGKFTPVEDRERIKDATEIWLKPPSVQAFTDLLNRAIDKPTESVELKVNDLRTESDEQLLAVAQELVEKAKPAVH